MLSTYCYSTQAKRTHNEQQAKRPAQHATATCTATIFVSLTRTQINHARTHVRAVSRPCGSRGGTQSSVVNSGPSARPRSHSSSARKSRASHSTIITPSRCWEKSPPRRLGSCTSPPNPSRSRHQLEPRPQSRPRSHPRRGDAGGPRHGGAHPIAETPVAPKVGEAG